MTTDDYVRLPAEQYRALLKERDDLRAELAARNVSASDRLHNLCAGLSDQADESPFTREEWERIDAENVRLRAELAALREAAGKVTCDSCEDAGVMNKHNTKHPDWWGKPCPDCADLRPLLADQPSETP